MSIDRKLAEKLRRIEALFAGATTEGERMAAETAIDRIKRRLEEYKQLDPPVEYKFSLNNFWSRKLFVALLRRYDLKPYRRYRQRHTTVLVKVSQKFVDDTLWPEFLELDRALLEHLDKITARIISEAIFENSSEAEEVKGIETS
ncbi:MAG: hypothetical protein ACE5FU_14575 [Nitrospinota bacterium]